MTDNVDRSIAYNHIAKYSNKLNLVNILISEQAFKIIKNYICPKVIICLEMTYRH